jgi:DNA-binding MarR family transcriptional regulator
MYPVSRQRAEKNGVVSTWDQNMLRELACFRYNLRKFLHFSEREARRHGVTSQQHQLLLGVAGYTDRDHATISELAEFLQERHHAASELVARCVKRGLVRKTHDTFDKRVVFVSLTTKGKAIVLKLSVLHRHEVERLKAGFVNWGFRPPTIHGKANRWKICKN